MAGLLILVGLAGTAWAYAPPGVGGPFGFPGGENCPLRKFIMGQMGRALVLRSELDLSSEQRTKLMDVAKSKKSVVEPAVRAMATKKRALRDAVLAEKPDEAAIRKAAADLGTTLGDLAVIASQAAGEAKLVLSTEQKQLIAKFLVDTDAAADRMLDEVKAKP